ncbi:type III toxin-antitoxin system ToxN/AbiQ family toxin [Cellulosilyticum ruminicola]|uniref:type III toxin-antitoxin system ToxN/AbiQ family toxin n=1 Tax=Cellulosilyticum ruminicola TaxID=425254 RepID=UPI0006D077E7|nr:type III toxin-antitoxin system ToxN/AbiQ family toxin [Cellulosilyticum ruminicola]
MELYEVTVDYVEYLREFEPKKILSNKDEKGTRKFLGIVTQKNGYNYVIPLSSPKYLKDYSIKDYTGEKLPEDFSFIAYADRIVLLKDTTVPVVFMYDKNGDESIDFFGKLQCNNMLPVPESELITFDVNSISDIAYRTLLQKQLQFLRKNSDRILKKHINPVYINRKKNNMSLGYIKHATPDFNLLEEKCTEWEESHKG